MATIKSFTSLEQSKKLAKILPPESADMHYCLEQRGVATEYEIGVTKFNYAKRFKGKCNIVDVQPAWSLASLFGILPEKYTELIKEGGMYRIIIKDSYMTCLFENPVDACVAMVEKLHESKML